MRVKTMTRDNAGSVSKRSSSARFPAGSTKCTCCSIGSCSGALRATSTRTGLRSKVSASLPTSAGMVAENSDDWRSDRQCGDDTANVTNEAEVEHAVRLVEHEMADLVQLQLAGAHQVADAAWRADHDVGARAHPLHLHEAADATKNGNDAALLSAEPAQAFLDLQCQFAGRRQDQGACGEAMRRRLIGCQVLQHRQGECGGLAGAGLGDAEQIAAGEQVRNGDCLDRRWLEEMRPVEGAQQRLGQAEGRKGHSMTRR